MCCLFPYLIIVFSISNGFREALRRHRGRGTVCLCACMYMLMHLCARVCMCMCMWCFVSDSLAIGLYHCDDFAKSARTPNDTKIQTLLLFFAEDVCVNKTALNRGTTARPLLFLS